jgi:Glycosyltransferase family 87
VVGPARAAVACGVFAVLAFAATAGAGESAAVPGLGPATWHPSWDAGLGLSSLTVSVVLGVANLAAAAAVALGLLAVHRGARPKPGHVLFAGLAAVLVLTAVPPSGSADHLSYLAYGRIAAAGDDPYVTDPLAWRDGADPVASAVQPPWQHTPSVYGPVATAVQAAVAHLGGGELRLTVWFWQLLMGAAFGAAGLVLDRLTRHDPAARSRAAVLWTLNPLLLGQLVLGGHLDVFAVAAALGAMALAARRPLAAGVLLGVAAGSKITFALFGLAVLWGLRHLGARRAWRSIGWGVLGSVLVLVPTHLWSGPHTYDQLEQAGRFVSLATPWRLLADLLDPVFGRPAVRSVVGPVALACAVGFGALLVRRVRAIQANVDAGPDHQQAAVTADILRAAVLLSAAWVLTTPYALPWYDAMVWGPLAALGAGSGILDAALLARLAALALAYVPGRVVAMSPPVEAFTLGFRRQVAPWLTLAVLIVVLAWACVPPRWLPPALRRRAAEAPVH